MMSDAHATIARDRTRLTTFGAAATTTALLSVLLLSVAVATPASAAYSTAAGGIPPPPPSPPLFPDSFVVATGTTIPFGGEADPISQSGMIWFDRPSGRARIDHFWLGHRRSLLIDAPAQRGYLVTDATCVTTRMTGRLLPVGVPATAARDSERNLVRGVPVWHYAAVDSTSAGMGSDGSSGSHLLHFDFYVRQQNWTAVAEDGTEKSYSFYFPWRTQSRRSERRELAPPPLAAPSSEESSRPNWRYWGERIHDELVVSPADGTASANGASSPSLNALARLVENVVVTVDFFDFTPMTPDASVFTVSGLCQEAADDPVEGEKFTHDIDLHDAQQLLTELSFSNEAGRRVVKDLRETERRRRLSMTSRDDL
jgi:hypothetical protein